MLHTILRKFSFFLTSSLGRNEIYAADESQYKKFLCTFFGLLLTTFLALWVWAAFGRFHYMDSEYPLWLYKKQKLENECFAGKTVILGDSRPMADLAPSELGSDVINLAIGGVTPIELYYTAKMMAHCSEPPRAIILSMAPFHYMTMESYWGRTLSFQFLTFDQAQEVQRIAQSDTKQTIYKLSMLGRLHDSIMNGVVLSSFPSFYYTKLIDGFIHPNGAINLWSMNNLSEHRGHVSMHQKVKVTLPSAETSLGKFNALPMMDTYMKMALDVFNAMGSPVYYMDMPITSLTDEKLPENYRKDYRNYLSLLFKPYPNAHLIGETLPVYPLDSFSDPFHLNYEGSLVYSRSIKRFFPEPPAP